MGLVGAPCLKEEQRLLEQVVAANVRVNAVEEARGSRAAHLVDGEVDLHRVGV